MLNESKGKAEVNHTEILTAGLIETDTSSIVTFPDEKTIEKELERYKQQLICKHLPDHCTQLLFLS